eukprot:SAG22_NODE_7455_length_737_cov_1.791536_1_plen_77_part_00
MGGHSIRLIVFDRHHRRATLLGDTLDKLVIFHFPLLSITELRVVRWHPDRSPADVVCLSKTKSDAPHPNSYNMTYI